MKLKTFVLNEFYPWSKANKSARAHELTVISMNRLMGYFGNISLKEIDIKKVEDFIIWRKQQCGNRTVNIDLTYLGQCLKKAVQYKHLKESPMLFVKRLKENTGRLRFFSSEEISLLLDNANPYIERFVCVGLMTGMRLGEMLNLKISQINFDKNIIQVTNTTEFQTKNRKNRNIPLPNQLRQKLLNYVNTWIWFPQMISFQRTKEQEVYLFCDEKGQKIKGFRKAYTRLLKKVGIKNATIHTMRHTYASHLVMNGVDLKTVQELLGHHSTSLTERYAHLSDKHKQKAVQLLQY